MEVSTILEELKAERARLDRAISVLDQSPRAVTRKARIATHQQPLAAPQPTSSKGKKGSMTPEGRKRLSLAMKKRWAERKKKDS